MSHFGNTHSIHTALLIYSKYTQRTHCFEIQHLHYFHIQSHPLRHWIYVFLIKGLQNVTQALDSFDNAEVEWVLFPTLDLNHWHH